jgi:hypothetical protein
LDYVNKLAKSNAEKKVVFKVGQAGNITSNACGKYLATSQRFTIKSVNEWNKIVANNQRWKKRKNFGGFF